MTDWTPTARGANEDPAEVAEREARHELLVELLAGYADGELPPETASQVEAHLVGCVRCRRELGVHQALRRRLGAEPTVGASSALRDRITAAVAAAPVPEPAAERERQPGRHARRVILVLVALALAISGAVVVNQMRDDAPALARIGTAPARVPLLAAVLADYQRVTSGDLPGRARDLDVVRGAVPFPVEPLRAPGLRLVAAWTTDLAGEPAAVLAYRWDDHVVLHYLVTEERFFRHPEVRRAVSGRRLLVASEEVRGIVAWPARAAGALLVGELPAERLATLAASDLLAGRTTRGAE